MHILSPAWEQYFSEKIKINHSSSNRVFSRDLLIPYRNWELKTENARAKQKCSAFGTE